MIGRLIIGVGLLVWGYHLGKEVGRTESLREELKRANDNGESKEVEASEPDSESDAVSGKERTD